MLKFLTTIVIIIAVGDVDCGVRSEQKMIKPINSEQFKTIAGNLNYGNETNGAEKNDTNVMGVLPVKEVFVSKPQNTNININTRDETLHDNRHNNNTNDDRKNDSIKIIDSQNNSSDGISTFNDFHKGYNSTDNDRNVYSALDININEEISKPQEDVSEIVEAISYLREENEAIHSKLNEFDDIISRHKYRDSGDDAKLDSNQDNDNTDDGTLDNFGYDSNSNDDSIQIINSSFPRRSMPLTTALIRPESPCVEGEYWIPENKTCANCPNPECKIRKCPPNQIWMKLFNKCSMKFRPNRNN